MDESELTKARKACRCNYCGKAIDLGTKYLRMGRDYRFHPDCWTLSRDPSAPPSVAQRQYVNALMECPVTTITTEQASLLIDRMKSLRELADTKAQAEMKALRDAAKAGAGAAELLAIPPSPRQAGEYEGHLIEVDVQVPETMSHKESVHGVVRVRDLQSGEIVHEEPVAGSVSLLKKDGPTTSSIVAEAQSRCRWWIHARVSGQQR